MTRRTGGRWFDAALWIVTALCHIVLPAQASSGLWHYAHNAWTPENSGLRGFVTALAQTKDGYMWLGTDTGLFRFDGVRVVAWAPPPGQPLPSVVVSALLATDDGTLWIGTRDGLASWGKGRLARYPALAGLEIETLFEDRDGTVWAGAWGSPTGRLCAILQGVATCYGDDGSLGTDVMTVYEDPKRRLWVAANSGLWRWKPGPPTRYASIRIGDRQALTQGVNDSDLAIVKGGNVRLFLDGRDSDYPLPGAPAGLTAKYLLTDRTGALWIGTDAKGLVYYSQGRAHFFSRADGLSSNMVSTLLEDQEGTIWVATAAGVDSLRPLSVASVSVSDGLSSETIRSVLAARDGSIWMGTATGLNRWKDGRMRVYRPQTDPGLPDEETEALCEDERGGIWVAGRFHGVAVFRNDRFTRVAAVPHGGITSMAADGHGGMWLSLWNPSYGLLHLARGTVDQRTPWSRLGGGPASGLVPDGDGGVWVGLLTGGMAYLRAGEIRNVPLGEAHAVEPRVLSLTRGSDGALWAGTERGLSRIVSGHVTTLTTANGLPCNTVHWAMEDGVSSYWLYTPCGLLRIPRAQMDAWIADSTRKVVATVLDVTDGISPVAVLNYARPQVAKSSDGKLWFVSNKLSVIDPTLGSVNTLPPPVHIEAIAADGKSYPPTQGLRLPALVRNLSIEYTALSLAVPQKVRFRYKLEGQDRDWREVVNDRRVQYSNIDPGAYRFRVTASNGSGVWNEQGASLDLSVAPAYWQTTWFRALCVAAALAFLAMLYWLRGRQLAHQFDMKLETRVDERTRIARELHDTLLQSFNAVLLRFRTVHRLSSTRPEEARQMLENAIDEGRRAVTEAREAVQGLRSSVVETNELSESIRTLAKELASDPDHGGAVEVRVNIEGTPRPLRPLIRDDIYRLVGEALRNAFHHAEASRIEVQLGYDARRFEVRVRDDGKGIDPRFLSEGLAGHYGIPGMRERAQKIGGKFTVWSAPDAGTEIALRVPGSRAYGAADSARGSWLAGRILRDRRGAKP